MTPIKRGYAVSQPMGALRGLPASLEWIHLYSFSSLVCRDFGGKKVSGRGLLSSVSYALPGASKKVIYRGFLYAGPGSRGLFRLPVLGQFMGARDGPLLRPYPLAILILSSVS